MTVKRGTMLTLYGETDGSSTTGTFTLNNEWFESGVSYIRVDKNIVAKIWSIEVSGAAVTVDIEITQDVTVDTPTWTKVKSVHLASEGQIFDEKRKPLIVIVGRTGKEAFRLTWSQATAGLSKVSLVVEFVEVE